MLLTVNEVAQELKVNKTYVYKLINTGILPSIKLGSRKVRREALESFLREYEGADIDKLLEGR